jgi:hypothetical protein
VSDKPFLAHKAWGFGACLSLLVACHHRGAPVDPTSAGTKIDCALGAGAALAHVCSVEEAQTDDGLTLTLHHPDGGFRRLLVTTDGRGVIAADGAAPAHVTLLNNHEIEVAIEDDRYHLPATVKP